ncbi:hypothetical protein AURDEDRAFT_163598 [Auricularia subglabra TFB-10046 SS5]|nr:hypothetical protein AURDEDRAFT_163598 [Auricularia subglabra TFB-10046 SS5]
MKYNIENLASRPVGQVDLRLQVQGDHDLHTDCELDNILHATLHFALPHAGTLLRQHETLTEADTLPANRRQYTRLVQPSAQTLARRTCRSSAPVQSGRSAADPDSPLMRVLGVLTMNAPLLKTLVEPPGEARGAVTQWHRQSLIFNLLDVRDTE